ncbi:phosphoheptose isomerase [Pedobacter cryoconitis]|uniref:Phosphoheptose isomerase n=1 Tax=Pedobacter cryoconitis TaxID=188932 RepID=A0A127VFM6_9SPHI|nr:D-sedoheptulose 7-phosphate isomerase [Pedobacter cryoconitis]AMP99718.1 phosphoheptose isomerase [Pedobacter cryoconitis]
MNFINLINNSILDHVKALDCLKANSISDINTAGLKISNAFKQGKKLLLIGNGGSAADAQHIAAEFTGRFCKERIALPAIALTTDTSALTAIGNDYGFEQIFARQIEALGSDGDVLIAFSTSGNSPNILKAVEIAKHKGLIIIGMSGNEEGKLNILCDINININHKNTARIQEMHILIGHILCESVESLF